MIDKFKFILHGVEKGFAEIKAKSSAGEFVHNLKESTKSGVEKIGVALKLTEDDSNLYSVVHLTAGNELVKYYSEHIHAISLNNEILKQSGSFVTSAIWTINNKITKENEVLSNFTLITNETLPTLFRNISFAQQQTSEIVSNIETLEAKLTELTQKVTSIQISVFKEEQEKVITKIEEEKKMELSRFERIKIREYETMMEKQRKKIAEINRKSAENEQIGEEITQKELDHKIEEDINNYIVYGFSANKNVSNKREVPPTYLEQEYLVPDDTKNQELSEFFGPSEPKMEVEKEEEEEECKIHIVAPIEEPGESKKEPALYRANISNEPLKIEQTK